MHTADQSQTVTYNIITEPSNPTGENNERSICDKYRNGVCPYGISGKGCAFYHPKRCHKFCRNGPNPRLNGCNKGSKCDWYHPKLCRYSLRDGICLNVEECNFTHLKGTRRFVTTSTEQEHTSRETQHYGSLGPSQRQSYNHNRYDQIQNHSHVENALFQRDNNTNVPNKSRQFVTFSR